MASENAPTGKIIQAAAGNFSTASMFSKDGVSLGLDASYETFLSHEDQIMDMSNAGEGSARSRKKK